MANTALAVVRGSLMSSPSPWSTTPAPMNLTPATALATAWGDEWKVTAVMAATATPTRERTRSPALSYAAALSRSRRPGDAHQDPNRQPATGIAQASPPTTRRSGMARPPAAANCRCCPQQLVASPTHVRVTQRRRGNVCFLTCSSARSGGAHASQPSTIASSSAPCDRRQLDEDRRSRRSAES